MEYESTLELNSKETYLFLWIPMVPAQAHILCWHKILRFFMRILDYSIRCLWMLLGACYYW